MDQREELEDCIVKKYAPVFVKIVISYSWMVNN